ncbi:hypothetical protein NC653_006904 [Populus alba x Populus x berolinensis]|uniref:Uncharacterized protein n=1 Tax=Populus alba x Populus x berolinensis TaxID=444605 RepID=A0AAD6RGZ5_9ROSI|nr:hypothetical protein NC653_006904 [Populus alba x Populus x berolinensis]
MEKWQEEIEELRLLDAYQMRRQVVFFIMQDMYSKILTLTLEGNSEKSPRNLNLPVEMHFQKIFHYFRIIKISQE